VIKTGFAWEIDPETGGSVLPVKNFGLIRDRSGLALRKSCFVVAGVIDADYRGEVMVALHNASNDEVVIKLGDRIAQMLVCVCYTYDIAETDGELTETKRGDAGFGSTGE
jgi:dUTP pyrophosphatase